MFKSKLMEAKTMLINYLEEKDLSLEDITCVEYLIDCIDYLLKGTVKITNENLEVIINDFLVTGSYLKDNVFLKIASNLSQLLEVTCQ